MSTHLDDARRVVTMFVHNDVSHDNRVLKGAASLVGGGYRVTVVGRSLRGSQLPAREERDGFTVIRIAPPLAILDALAWVRWPWRMRGRVVRAVSSGARRPPRGWLRAAGAIGGSLLALPWVAYRLADVYLLGDRAPTLGRRGALDWALRWRYSVIGWGRRAALAAPVSAVWHAHDLSAIAAAVEAQRLHGGRIVYDSHEIYLETTATARLPRPIRRWLRRQEGRSIDRAAVVVTVAEGSRDELRRRYRVGRDLVVRNSPPRWDGTPVMAIGATHERADRLREALRVPAGTPVAVYHGGFSHGRGMETLAAALLEPAMAGVHGVFLGYGELEGEVASWAADPRYGGRLHLLPAVPPEEVVPWIAAADVGICLIMPTTLNHRLTLPNKLFEALAGGVPVIGSDFPQYRRVLLDEPGGPLGVVVDPADPRALAAAVAAIVGQPVTERTAQRARCAAAAQRTWNWEAQFAPLLDVYAELTGGPVRPPMR